MTTFATLALEFVSRADKAIRDMKGVEGAADGAEAAADRLSKGSKKLATDLDGAGNKAKKATDELDRLTSVAKKLATALFVRELVQMADAWSDLRSQLGAAIGDMGAANDMMGRMLEIANASYSPLGQTVQVYARNVAVLRDLGKSAGQAADFTESLNHMLVVTATRGERATAVQDALSKAMAVGRLQADGLETVLAHGGRVAQALAVQLDTTVSGLRALASEGKITGEVIADAIINPLEEVRSAAGEMDATVADAFVRLHNNLIAFVGQTDQANGASALLAGGIFLVADNVDLVSQMLLVLTATRIPVLISGLTASAGAASALGSALALAGGPWGLAIGTAAALGLALYGMTARTDEARDAVDALNEAIRTEESRLGSLVREMRPGVTMTLALANAKLKEAQSIIASTEAKRLDAIQQQMLTREYRDLQSAIEAAAGDLEGLKDGPWGAEFYKDDVAELTAIIEEARAKQQTLLDDVGAVSPEIQSWIDRVGQLSEQIRLANGEMITFGGSAEEVAAITADAQAKSLATAQDMLAASRRQIELLQAQQQYGKDSVAVAITRLNHERELYRARVDAFQIDQRQKQVLMDSWMEVQRLEGKTRSWDAAMAIVAETGSDILGILQTIGQTEPGGSWLDTAIGKAGRLWGALSGAAGALGALMGETAPESLPASDDPAKPSGGGGTDRQSRLDALVASLQTEAEALEAWHEAQLIEINRFTDLELEAIGGRNEAKIRLEAELQERLMALRHQEQSMTLGHYGTFFGNMAAIAEAGGDRMLGITKAFSVAQGLINSYRAFTEVLADPSLMGRPMLRTALAYSTLAAGLAQVASMRSVSKGSSGGGRSGGASKSSDQPAQEASPVNVTIRGLNPDSLYTGKQVIEMTDAVQKELTRRGVVFSFAS